MTEETLEDFIDRMDRDPNSVRREWEAKWLQERGQEWYDKNEPSFSAWWDVVLMMHGYEV